MADERRLDSGIRIKPIYTQDDLFDWSANERLGAPGQFPFTRGAYEEMYRSRLWTMRQYSGFGTAEETNIRFHYLLAAGQTGLSCAFDLPTQMGIDSDDDRAAGEVGRVGVAIDSLDDMRALLKDIPLEEVSLSMTINATAPSLLLLVQLVAEERGVASDKLQGTIQNDILKEYIARGTYIYPPAASLRLVTDSFSYCRETLPKWHPISISGYHIREAGSTSVQELAFTLANAISYVDAAIAAGLAIDEFAPRLSFFWNAHNNFLEEVAKFRAARRMWAQLVRDRWNGNEKSQVMKFHVQTGGSTLVAQQPLNNVVRTTLQALAAVLGGTQSLHTNAFDEALGLPTEDSAKLALRTQQVIAFESGVIDTVDPLAGSFVIERLTDEIETRVNLYLDEIARLGGAVEAIEAQYQQSEIENAALQYARDIDAGTKKIVGVNSFKEGDNQSVTVFPIDQGLANNQIQRVRTHKQNRSQSDIAAALDKIGAVAQTDQNLMPSLRDALKAGATIGECSEALKQVFGSYRESV